MPAPGARSKAIKQGLAEYWTGKPCPHGHVTQRRTPDGSCFGIFETIEAASAAYMKAAEEAFGEFARAA